MYLTSVTDNTERDQSVNGVPRGRAVPEISSVRVRPQLEYTPQRHPPSGPSDKNGRVAHNIYHLTI